jgi:hypothetical protein
VTFVQRFDSTLGNFVHFHVVVPDGVFSRTDDGDGAVTFHAGLLKARSGGDDEACWRRKTASMTPKRFGRRMTKVATKRWVAYAKRPSEAFEHTLRCLGHNWALGCRTAVLRDDLPLGRPEKVFWLAAGDPLEGGENFA